MSPRSVEDRIGWFLNHDPAGVGMCAQHTWHALGGDQGDPPPWGAASANVCIDKIEAAGRYWTPGTWPGPPPRGAWIGYRYGQHGHACLSLGDGRIATTDPSGDAGGSGVENLDYPNKWGASGWDIWTDTYNGVRFDVGIGPGDVLLSRLQRGTEDSDSVRRLQDTLNSIPLQGGTTLPVTGNYGERTVDEVSLWQLQVSGVTPFDGTHVTAEQATRLFAGTGHNVIDDLNPPPQPETGTGLGLWTWYSGKPSGNVTVHPDGEWHALAGLRQPASGITADSTEFHFLYTRVELPSGRSADRVVETKFVRSDGDATAYSAETFGLKKDSYPLANTHFEAGSGLGGQWWVKVTGGTDPITLTTRYAKTHVHYLDSGEVAGRLAGRGRSRFIRWVLRHLLNVRQA